MSAGVRGATSDPFKQMAPRVKNDAEAMGSGAISGCICFGGVAAFFIILAINLWSGAWPAGKVLSIYTYIGGATLGLTALVAGCAGCIICCGGVKPSSGQRL